MRGDTALVEMRTRGKRPATVTVETSTDPGRWCDTWHREIPEHAQLFIEPAEKAERLDLRCLVGCQVTVHGDDQHRVHEIFDACRDHAAARVIAHVFAPRGEELQSIEILDTEGVLTWHK